MHTQIRNPEQASGSHTHLLMPFDSPDHTGVAGHRTPGTTSSGSSAEAATHYLAVRAGLTTNSNTFTAPTLADNDCCPFPGSPEKLRLKAWTSLVSGANPNMLVYDVTGSTSPEGLASATTRDGIRFTGYVRKLVEWRNINLRGMVPDDTVVKPAGPGESVDYVWALAGDYAPPPNRRPQYIVYFFRPGRAKIEGLPSTYQSWWFNPITGQFTSGQTSGQVFDTDDAEIGTDHDWVLYIDGGVIVPQKMTLAAVADAYVEEANPTANHGSSSKLSVSYAATDFGRFSFLKFNIPSFSGRVTSAKLLMRTKNTPVSQSAVY
ncbi:MAG: DNRLRE domain-containing protein, partial [bacterium]|nr:DNRLRE domain-containing protein [bacterium]